LSEGSFLERIEHGTTRSRVNVGAIVIYRPNVPTLAASSSRSLANSAAAVRLSAEARKVSDCAGNCAAPISNTSTDARRPETGGQ
jgi:hypothetical protein